MTTSTTAAAPAAIQALAPAFFFSGSGPGSIGPAVYIGGAPGGGVLGGGVLGGGVLGVGPQAGGWSELGGIGGGRSVMGHLLHGRRWSAHDSSADGVPPT